MIPSTVAAPARSTRIRPFVAVAALSLTLVAGCAAPPPSDIDRFEAANRRTHAFNKGFDRNVLRPTAFGYGGTAPGPVRKGINNFALNLGLPGDIVNSLLQGRPGPVLENTARLVVNTTVGIGGLLDPATELGIVGNRTDFGETLHVWGVGEGPYIELPLAGPSTGRDTVGLVVDIALDPMRYILPTAEANASTGLQILAGLGRRYQYSETVDSILYESADSYAQLRLLYLQNRRFELGQTAGSDESFIDPYEDFNGE